MRNHTIATAAIVAFLIPAAAAAVTLDQLVADADCNGWNAEVTVDFRPGAQMARLEYVVLLRDEAGGELERFEYSDWISIPSTPTEVYNLSGTWSGELDGTYSVVGDFSVYDIFADGYNLTGDSATLPLQCGDAGGGDLPPPPDPCRYASVYWQYHPEAWPVSELELGGRTYSQERILAMMAPQHWWSLTIRLSAQLAIAKLNVANGAAAEPGGLIDRADAYLEGRPGHTRFSGRFERQRALHLAMKLWHWNRSGCPAGTSAAGGPMGTDYRDDMFSTDFAADKATVETMNLGTLKSMYR